MIAQRYADLVGRTPMLELSRIEPNLPARIVAKLEMFNPSSIKDRPALFMIRALERAGRLTPDAELVEASSGNTAIGVATLCASLGVKTRFFMSELVSRERVAILKALGAEVTMTPGVEHTKGARLRAIAYCDENPHAIYLNQHDNDNNHQGHYETTGPEIWNDLGDQIVAYVAGLGSGGSMSGVGRYLKARKPSIKIIGFEPAASPVYSGGKQGVHRLIGIGPGFKAPLLERWRHLLDELVLVSDEDAYRWARRLARTEGMFAGITSGAAVKVACDVAKRPEFAGGVVLCFLYDRGERYLSVEGLYDGRELPPRQSS